MRSGEPFVQKKDKSKKKKRKQVVVENPSTSRSTASVIDSQPREPKRQKKRKRQCKSVKDGYKTNKGKDSSSLLSLASRLKRQRGTAESTPMPPQWSQQEEYRSLLKQDKKQHKRFLTPSHKLFDSCYRECYRAFVCEEPDQLPRALHNNFDQAFDALHHGGLFLYDAIQAGGKKVSRTHVTRTLVGNPGSTYRYLGLRLFSHPWSDGNDGDDDATLSLLMQWGYSREVAQALCLMGQLNQSLTQRTQRSLQKHVEPSVGLVGSAKYTLTLVNRMEPSSIKRDLKQDTVYGMGKTTVSWHRDSGLMDFSSIAVYHSLREQIAQKGNTTSSSTTAWRVALRVADKDCPTPPLVVPLPSGSVYYLLDDFNHNHEHAVLTGQQQVRYSSTHRVARDGRGTWQYIRDKCQSILEESNENPFGKRKNKRGRLVKKTHAQQHLLVEIEFEWLRQWHVQGELHASLHPYWHEPMKKLSKWYQKLEHLSLELVEVLQSASKKGQKDADNGGVSEDLYDVMIESLQERIQLERVWEERLKDPFYQSLPANMQPFPCPALHLNRLQQQHDKGSASILPPTDLERLLSQLRKWRAAFVKNNSQSLGDPPSKALKDSSKLTKKEKRKIASNWEMLKDTL